MRRIRRTKNVNGYHRNWLFIALGIIALAMLSVNCTLEQSSALFQSSAVKDKQNAEQILQSGDSLLTDPGLEATDDQRTEPQLDTGALWADVTDTITTTPRTSGTTSPTRISLNVKDANLLDLLSLLAYKLDANIIYLGEPTLVTMKTESLSVITTLQLLLQKEGLDYLTIGKNYIVASRDRLYSDFNNRMFLSRYDLFYVAASAMEGYIAELGMPVQSLAVDANQRALWIQGTPMTLAKARELINTLDVIENAAFAEGGYRKIRMPVAVANGSRAEEELEALIDLLSILLDGFRDGRTDMGWVTWDHPDPIPYIYMDWESPIIKPYDLKMKITRDFAGNYNSQIRYLIAEGTPDNIDLVNQMISAISSTPSSPLAFSTETAEDIGGVVQWVPDQQVQSQSQQQSASLPQHTVKVSAVPAEGGNLSGGGKFTQGSTVTITANPAENYEFVRWIEGGAEISTSSSHVLTIYSDRNFEAVFVKKNIADTEDFVEEDFEDEQG